MKVEITLVSIKIDSSYQQCSLYLGGSQQLVLPLIGTFFSAEWSMGEYPICGKKALSQILNVNVSWKKKVTRDILAFQDADKV